MFRLFAGLTLPDYISDHLATIQKGLPGARWIAPENVHLTLRFIGDVNGAAADDLDAALAGLSVPAFDLELGGVDVFGKDQPRALFLDVATTPALDHLAAKVASAVNRAGLANDRRKFKPHITLARFRHPRTDHIARFIERHNRLRFSAFRVDEFVLFRNHLTAAGAHYERLVAYPLLLPFTSPGKTAI